MTGFSASSSERHAGLVTLDIVLSGAAAAGALELVERRVRAFIAALAAGFFFPARLRDAAPAEVRAGSAAVRARFEVDDMPVSAFDVLGGMLADSRQHGVTCQSAFAVLGRREWDLQADSGLRPDTVEHPPFAVEWPQDLGGNYALLVEIEFAEPVPADIGQGLLDTLALWDALTLAYPDEADEPVEVSGAQAMFNDPRTIHYHEWIWDQADTLAWNLIVNLCCAWHMTRPIVRVHFE